MFSYLRGVVVKAEESKRLSLPHFPPAVFSVRVALPPWDRLEICRGCFFPFYLGVLVAFTGQS